MANSLIEDVMNERPINNDGEKKQKQPKNKGSKKAIIILIILLLIIIIAAVIVMLVLSSRNSEVNAKQAFFDAINIDPMNIKARIAYAISLTKELEYAQSIEQFSEVLKYIPDNADTLYNLALAYELVGDIERAIKFYKKAIDIENDHKEANHNIELLLGEPYVPHKDIEYIDDTPSASEEKQEENKEIIDVQEVQESQEQNEQTADVDTIMQQEQEVQINPQDSMFS